MLDQVARLDLPFPTVLILPARTSAPVFRLADGEHPLSCYVSYEKRLGRGRIFDRHFGSHGALSLLGCTREPLCAKSPSRASH